MYFIFSSDNAQKLFKCCENFWHMNKTRFAFCIPFVSANFWISARVFSSFLGQADTHKARDLILWCTISMLHGSKKNTYLRNQNRKLLLLYKQNKYHLARTNLQSVQKHKKFDTVITAWVKRINRLDICTTNTWTFIYFRVT